MYIPIIYKIPQTKKEWKNFCLFFGLILIAISIFIGYCFVDDYNDETKLSSLKNPEPSQITSNDEIFEFDSVAVIGCYATTESDYAPTYYHFIVAYFTDEKDDTAYLATISLNKDDGEIFNKMLNDSANDDIHYLSFCANTNSVENMDKDIYSYYQEVLDDCQQNLYTYNVENSGLRLFYCFDTPDQFNDYLANSEKNSQYGIITFVIIITVGIALIIFGAIKRGPTKKQLAQAREYLKNKETYNAPEYAQPDEDDRFSYIHSDEYFQKPNDDYDIKN